MLVMSAVGIIAVSLLVSWVTVSMFKRTRNLASEGAESLLRRQVIQAIVVLILILPASWIVGMVSSSGPLLALDEAFYNWLNLNSGSTLVWISGNVTEIGSITGTGFVGILIGLIFGMRLYSRGMRYWSLVPGCLALAGFFASLRFQRLIDGLNDRPKPPENISIGAPGGFPSGGASRIVVTVGVIGLLVAADLVSQRQLAFTSFVCAAICMVEIISRAALARHWPVDLLVGSMQGVAILYVARPVVTWLGIHTQPREMPRVPDARMT